MPMEAKTNNTAAQKHNASSSFSAFVGITVPRDHPQ